MDLKRVVFPMLRSISKRTKTGRYPIRAPTCFYGQGSVDLTEQRGFDKKWLETSVQPLERLHRKRNWLVRRSPMDRWDIRAYFSVA